MDTIIHTVELEEAVKEYNAGIHPAATGIRLNVDEFQEYETASEAVRELESLEMEEKAALEHLLDSTMIIVFENSIIVRRIY